MKAVILAGGFGTRISEETDNIPKPILWYIMKMYSAHGITDFVICCGYKGYVIKEYSKLLVLVQLLYFLMFLIKMRYLQLEKSWNIRGKLLIF